MIILYKLNDFISVFDDVTMITIDNICETKDVMADILEKIAMLSIEIEIVDYHINYKGSKVTLLVENGGILRTIRAAGMFKEEMNSVKCNVYCRNSAVLVSVKKSPLDTAVKIIKEFKNNNIEFYHLFSGGEGIIVVINEAYTDMVCDMVERLFG